MLDWLRGARRRRRRDVAAATWPTACATCSATAARFGVRLRYVEEPRPLGTGGALKFAEALLDERFLMLNGDVLTDIDLTRAARPARARPARARTLALTPVEDPSAYGLVRTDARRRGHRVRREAVAPTRSTRNNISAGAYVLERSVLDLLEPGEPGLDRARRLPAAGRRRALRLRRRRATGSTSGRPSATCRATFDILEGTVAHRGRRAHGRRATCASRTASRAQGRIIPSALVESGCRIGAGARVGGRVVLERGVTRRREHDDRARRRACAGAEIGARLHAAAAASSAPACAIGDHCTIDGHERARRGRDARRRQRGLQRRADLPGRRRCPTAAIRF